MPEVKATVVQGNEDDVDDQQVDAQVDQQIDDTVDTTDDDTTQVSDDDNSGLSAQEQKEARELYRLLKDKQTQKSTLTLLAQRAGLLQAETPKEVKAAKKELKDIVKETLGPEYGFLADKLSATMEAVLEQERQTTNELLNTVQVDKIERETSSALDRLSRETKGESKKFEDRMIALMDRIKPSDNLSVYEYLKDLYTLASSGQRTASTKAAIADKIKRNAGNAAERLQSRGTGKEGKPGGPEKRGIRASVEYALKQMGIQE